jgi:hypothetical protein
MWRGRPRPQKLAIAAEFALPSPNYGEFWNDHTRGQEVWRP